MYALAIKKGRRKEYERGTQKQQQLPLPFWLAMPEVPIHTRHYERRYFRHRRYGSLADLAIDLLDLLDDFS